MDTSSSDTQERAPFEKTRDRRPRSHLASALLLGAYAALIVALVLCNRYGTVIPVVLETQDVLHDPSGSPEFVVHALDASSRRPLPGVALQFWRERSPRSDAPITVRTDAQGMARVSFASAEAAPRVRGASAEERCFVTLEPAPRLLLGSPWRFGPSGDVAVVLDGLGVERGTRFLLVDLDALHPKDRVGEAISVDGTATSASFISSAPSEGFREEVASMSRLQHRALYISSAGQPCFQGLKFWLARWTLPPGLLVGPERGEAKTEFLARLRGRLGELGASVGSVLCGREGRTLYETGFAGATIVAGAVDSAGSAE